MYYLFNVFDMVINLPKYIHLYKKYNKAINISTTQFIVLGKGNTEEQ
jgi:hypothetical protein